MFKRIVTVLVVGLLLFAGVGCGDNPQKGTKKGLDMPQPLEKGG